MGVGHWIAIGTLIAGSAASALDLAPASLAVAMVDSTRNPDQDSVSITLVLSVKNGSTPVKPKVWTAVEISVDGTLKMTGIVDSGQTLASGQNYTWKIGAWVDKKPFTVLALTDPKGLLSESAADAANNLLVRKFAFRPAIAHDTLYTGIGCAAAKGN